MTFCRKCVMPSTRPDLSIGPDGVCGACNSAETKGRVDWAARRANFATLTAWAKDQARERGNAHDVVVGVSGGKDSHFIVRECLRAGLRPLGVCFEPSERTEPGTSNLANLGRFCDIVEVRKNRTVYQRMRQVGLRTVGDPEFPNHIGIFTSVVREAVRRNIPLVLFGEDPVEEYGPTSTTPADRQLDRTWLEQHGGLLGLRVQDLISSQGLEPRDLAPYIWPSANQIARVGLCSQFLGHYIAWDSVTQAEIVRREMGFRWASGPPYTGAFWPFENLDDSDAVAFHDFLALCKYSYTRAATQVSIEIRHGHRSRVQGIDIVQVSGDRYPEAEEAAFCESIGMPPEEVRAICAAYVSPAIWQDDNVLRLRRRPECEVR